MPAITLYEHRRDSRTGPAGRRCSTCRIRRLAPPQCLRTPYPGTKGGFAHKFWGDPAPGNVKSVLSTQLQYKNGLQASAFEAMRADNFCRRMQGEAIFHTVALAVKSGRKRASNTPSRLFRGATPKWCSALRQHAPDAHRSPAAKCRRAFRLHHESYPVCPPGTTVRVNAVHDVAPRARRAQTEGECRVESLPTAVAAIDGYRIYVEDCRHRDRSWLGPRGVDAE